MINYVLFLFFLSCLTLQSAAQKQEERIEFAVIGKKIIIHEDAVFRKKQYKVVCPVGCNKLSEVALKNLLFLGEKACLASDPESFRAIFSILTDKDIEHMQPLNRCKPI